MSFRIAVVLTTSAVVLASMVTPALADPTVHFNEPEACFDDGFGTTTCQSSLGKYHISITPSGNEHITGRGTTTYSVVSPTSSLHDTRTYMINHFVKRGELHIFKEQSTETFVIDGRTCTMRLQFHFSNGRIQFDRPEVTCDPDA